MNKTLKSFIAILIIVFTWSTVEAQNKSQEKSFNYPVLVKIIQGNGNVFRIGFIRYNDFYGVKEDESNPSNIYANFIGLANVTRGDFKNKCFVYFPLAKGNGEIVIIDKADITKLNMTYDQAMKLIVVEGNN